MLDRNSILGLVLIGSILIGWFYFNAPSKEELARQQQVKDSLVLVEKKKLAEAQLAQKKIEEQKALSDSNSVSIQNDTSKAVVLSDSAKLAIENKARSEKYLDFVTCVSGEDKDIVIENDHFKALISTKGARVHSIALKNHKKFDGVNPVILFDKDSSRQAIQLMAYNNTRVINTDSLYFTTDKTEIKINGSGTAQIKLKAQTAKANSYIEFVYTVKGDDYMLNWDVNMVNMQEIVSSTTDQLNLIWSMHTPTQEQHIEKERQTSTAYWKFPDASADYINPGKEEEKSLNESPIEWVAFKQQFFTCAVIANDKFMKDGSFVRTQSNPTSFNYVKIMQAELGIPYNHGANEKFSMRFYFGPNRYYTLKDYKIGLEDLINIGWTGFNVLNTWLVIPVFNAFADTDYNFGWIILGLTFIIKLVLFPIAYKTYLSSAKMRLLKPELDVINAKFGDDPMKKNNESMALYRKAGVSPFSGCIPALIQIPILIALFNFFPASIELRQKAFLWAHDLSTYDSVWDFGYVPVINSIYGDHVSLFALLMFVSTIIYTWMNSSMLSPQQTQMPGMKFMMYFMPVIFLSFMNSYSAGLSWYYFLANMITFLQTWLMRKFISDDKLRAEIDNNMKKPAKKSGFQQRLEDMAKQRGIQAPGQQKKK